jgi:hypothetical protein
VPDERLEDWPPAHRELLVRGLRRRFVTSGGATVWEFDEMRLDPFHPGNGELYRSLRLGIAEAIVLVMRTPRDPKHLFEVVGLQPPADGLGVMEYRAVETNVTHELIVRRACTYTRGSMVIGELQWVEGEGALNRIVNPLQARRGRERQEIADALAGLRVMSNLTKRAGGRPADWPDEDTFRAKVEPVVRSLRKQRGKATRDNAAEELSISSDYLKDLTHDLTGLSWPEFVKTVPDKEV